MSDISQSTTRKWVLGSIVVFGLLSVLMFVLASMRGERGSEPEGRAPLAAEQAAVPDTTSRTGGALRLVEHQFEPTRSVIEGSIMNTTNFNYVNVQVQFDLLDETGAVVGAARDTTSNVGPGETWIFSTPASDVLGVARVRLAEISGGRMEGNAPGDELDPNRAGRLAAPDDSTAAQGQAYGRDNQPE